MELTDAQRARIAKPAQAYIEYLEMRVRELEKHIADLSAGPEGARVLIEDYVHPVRPLPDNAHVTFWLDDPQDPRAGYVQVKLMDGYVEVYAGGGGERPSLHVTPQSSNVVRVRMGEY
jgi:hypothetical protein